MERFSQRPRQLSMPPAGLRPAVGCPRLRADAAGVRLSAVTFRAAPLALALLPSLWAAEPVVETGEINGAKFRIDRPANWNGELLMYCHGYNPQPGDPTTGPQNAALAKFVERGVAVAQSGYAAGGWAIPEAVQDTEALRRHFTVKHGPPKRTFVAGHSMGGFLTMTLMERFPDVYAGGLPLCGPLGPAIWFMERRIFDLRVVFDYYFPGALPPPDAVPAEYRNTDAETQRVLAMLEGEATKCNALLAYSGIRTAPDFARTITFWTFILNDLRRRSSGNAFDNRSTIYEGSPDDNALNAGVRRYAAGPGAQRFLRANYTPTGRLGAPMLHVHTTYDPLVPPWMPNRYAEVAAAAGTADLYAQQYVPTPGHCAISPDETIQAYERLLRWIETGERPAPGLAR
jgi:pimeloyl-ACP methyl ester carboxylesterase